MWKGREKSVFARKHTMKISVLGCGRWGSFISWYLNKIGHDLTLYGRKGGRIDELMATRNTGILTLPSEIKLTTSLENALESEYIVISIGAQGLRDFIKTINNTGRSCSGKTFILCMKGLEIGTGTRLSQIVKQELKHDAHIAVWIGPGHVQEFYSGIPNCMVIDSEEDEVKKRLIKEFSSEIIRFYYGKDIVGNEIGAASKNVIGIAAGILDGLNLSSLKGALMSRGTREIARLIEAMGGRELSAYGLCHLGDYEATVFSQYSHNRMYGEMLVRGEEYARLAEGYYTAKAMVCLGRKYNVSLPICEAVEKVLYQGHNIRETLDSLFARSIKDEF